MRQTTLRDVAELAGVSPRTVSNVVNGYARVTDATREKVERAIAQLGYRPNVLARNLATGRSGQIVVVVPYLDTPYFAELLQGIIPAARKLGYNVLVDQTDGDRDHEGELIGRGSRRFLFDGMIFSPLGLSQEDLSVRDPDLPLVVLGERSSDGTFDHVGIDDVAASTDAVSHLFSIGRRRIAAIGDQPYPTGEAAQLRTQGYRAAHALFGRPVDESLIISTARFNRADGATAMAALLDRADPPDAVFCYSDLVASGAIHAIHQRGLRVPEDVAIIGYDDIEDGRYSSPTISTIQPDKKAIAQMAVDRLVKRIASPSPVPGVELRAEHRLIARESTLGVATSS
ncbi:LacI family DNA-binding transcriptional regulator [Paractinoplanes atraurantiacus]|uniref:DNA-binding transcriptional regulator, LacI/PurR family n=1 Tax=Paractinoplanes atraurantiacus TaxID=1036182 RepID=A0A285JUJ9_9ACTN|nr:LacI family DNA-binding transcriptional regulator [Actinoplanes atraurantiacus]SNY62996.1 DNA-binding transcriptional regulator, LacI/PurR family [Actinoplanes atraurantiacus]